MDINLQGISWDVMIAAYVLNPGEKISLENLLYLSSEKKLILQKRKRASFLWLQMMKIVSKHLRWKHG